MKPMRTPANNPFGWRYATTLAVPAGIVNRRKQSQRRKKSLFPLFAPVRTPVLAALIAVLNLLPAGHLTAQSFTTLHSFTAGRTNSSGVYTNSDGANPVAGLITNSSGNTLYGTTVDGGSSGHGTVFAVNTDGTGFTTLHSFTGGSDGANPPARLILSGNTLYGTASGGGYGRAGTVFSINTD